MSNRNAAKSRATPGAAKMSDVAKLAGVSMITVSRAIREPDRVLPATLARIEAAIRSTGYVPNLTAGSLASNRSRIVGAIVPTIDNSIFAETVRGLSTLLEEAGYQLLLGQTAYRENAEEALVTAFLGRRVDGMVLTGTRHSAATVRRLKAAAIPVVETWDLTKKPVDMLAGFSNRDAGRAIATYLLGRGYRRLGFVGGAEERTRSRFAGFEAAVRATPGAHLSRVELDAGTSFAGGREALARLIDGGAAPRAVFFSNDALAMGGLMECHRRGLAVPGDIAIAGFADLDIAAESSPTLTSVHVGSRRIGEEAARLLLGRFDGSAAGAPVRDTGFAVVARESA
jgi:LacI family gluconate utilization system Gnt-I transcriptional repressor